MIPIYPTLWSENEKLTSNENVFLDALFSEEEIIFVLSDMENNRCRLKSMGALGV